MKFSVRSLFPIFISFIPVCVGGGLSLVLTLFANGAGAEFWPLFSPIVLPALLLGIHAQFVPALPLRTTLWSLVGMWLAVICNAGLSFLTYSIEVGSFNGVDTALTLKFLSMATKIALFLVTVGCLTRYILSRRNV